MRLRILGLPALLLLGAAAATAAPVDFDCDTNEGSFSEISQVQAGPVYHVRGTLTPVQWREDPRWLPSAQVRIETGGDARGIAIRMVRAHGAERADFGVQVTGGTSPRTTTLGSAALNQAVPFELSLLASGDAVVTFGGERRVFHLDLGPNAKIHVVCSTGEFLFGGLDLGG
jgi:hypothetical protein